MNNYLTAIPEGFYFKENADGLIELFYNKNLIEEVSENGKFMGWRKKNAK